MAKKELLKNEEVDNKEVIDENEIITKPLTPQQLIHQSKAPLFANANRFGKGATGAINNRQRPGRAASRGR